MWVIIKKIKQENGKELPVIVLNSQDEIWEFKHEEEAEKMSEVFNKNSHSGKNTYEIKKL
jgi:hypothetical protein